MIKTTENQLTTELRQLHSSGSLCQGIYPKVKLSDCAKAALGNYIEINICKNQLTSNSVNYNYLIGILPSINSNINLSDKKLWNIYRNVNPNSPGSGHQIPGVGKALINAGYYP